MLKGGYFAHKCQNVKRKGKLVHLHNKRSIDL